MIQIGSALYTQEQIDAINAQYGPGFLQRNPHYPAPGIYDYGDGFLSQDQLLTIEKREQMRRCRMPKIENIPEGDDE